MTGYIHNSAPRKVLNFHSDKRHHLWSRLKCAIHHQSKESFHFRYAREGLVWVMVAVSVRARSGCCPGPARPSGECPRYRRRRTTTSTIYCFIFPSFNIRAEKFIVHFGPVDYHFLVDTCLCKLFSGMNTWGIRGPTIIRW